MDVILTIVGFLIVLGAVVFIHELGHYWTARICGIRVDAFSIGFRPVLRWRDRRGTEWRLGWVPFGGYCTIHGMDDLFDRKRYDELPAEERRGHYLSVSAWKQAFIIAGGVIMNFLLAFAIYFGLFWAKPQTVQLPVVGDVAVESVAAAAGIRSGDTVVMIDNKKISSWPDLLLAREMAVGRDAELKIARGDALVSVTLAPSARWGISADPSKTEIQRNSAGGAIVAGARETWIQSKTLVVVLRQIVTGERSSKQLVSFITIAQVSGKALAAGAVALLSIIALLSVNLAVINLLPLPVLDGGHLLKLAVEGMTGKRLQGKTMEYVFMAGWILIGLLFVLTMWNDIVRVLGLGNP
jgi:regulator of sigma E protease